MKKILLYIATAALALTTTSCELDFDPQGGTYTDEMMQEYIKDHPDEVLGSFAQNIVGTMRGYKLAHFPMDLQGNDMVLYNTTNYYKSEYQFLNLRGDTDGFAGGKWGYYYGLIYMSNQILSSIPEIDEAGTLTESSKKVLSYKALALTFRGMGYYYLMTLFQDDYTYGGKEKLGVPIYTYEGQPAGPRATSDESFEQAVNDLKEAVRLYDLVGYDPLAEVEDIDQSIANLLLARAALTWDKYDDAIKAAEAVIGAGYHLMSEADYVTTIDKDRQPVGNGFQIADLPEALMSYRWTQNTTQGVSAFASFISPTGSGYASEQGGGYFICIDQQLYDEIPNTDYRKKNFMTNDVVDAAHDNKMIFPKYVNTKFAVPSYEADEVYFRLSEAYLLKAEAEAAKGDYSAAQNTLYELVSKRDKGYKKSTKTGDALMVEIHLQSRIELWGEGHEYYTNKRFNVGVDRSGSDNHVDRSIHPAGKFFTYLIPKTEMQRNPAITENNPL